MSVPAYSPDPDCFDEAYTAEDEPRAHYAPLLEALGECDLRALRERVNGRVVESGLTFGEDEPIAVDPVPRLIDASEWNRLQAGLLQRARALNSFLHDAYGGQRIFDAGVVPRRLLETSENYVPAVQGMLDPEAPPATVAGLDLVRGRDGELQVIEDNVRMPSGATYALALREIVGLELEGGLRPRGHGDYVEQLGAALRAAAPEGRDEPVVAILSDGPENGAWYEHERISAELGLPIVAPNRLELSRERVFARLSRERRVQVDVLYRRQDARLSEPGGGLTELGAMLLPALRSGRLRLANALGAGLADDKLTHAYVERMIDFYLGEEPLLRSVPSYDLSNEEDRREAMERLEELVVKPRGGYGGHGVTIMPRASEPERKRAVAVARRRPERFIAQEPVEISSHPTVRGERLRPRRIDLRPFVISGPEGATPMIGGLTRFAQGAGEMVVNSSQGGGCKDTWVMETSAA